MISSAGIFLFTVVVSIVFVANGHPGWGALVFLAGAGMASQQRSQGN